jgi:Anti-sigma factor NepR
MGAMQKVRGSKSCYKLLAARHRPDTGLQEIRHPGENDIEHDMTPASCATARNGIPDPRSPYWSLERRVRAFLDGKTHGEDLLHALYDHILDEPVPERLLALLTR